MIGLMVLAVVVCLVCLFYVIFGCAGVIKTTKSKIIRACAVLLLVLCLGVLIEYFRVVLT